MMRADNAQYVHLAGWTALKLMMLAMLLMLVAATAALAQQRASLCPQQYDPVCAEKKVQQKVKCVRAPCLPIVEMRRLTFSNACFARAAGAKVLYHGVCGKPTRNDPDGCGKPGRHARPGADPTCKSWTDGCNICRRTRPGARAACTKMACAKKGPARCLTRFGERF